MGKKTLSVMVVMFIAGGVSAQSIIVQVQDFDSPMTAVASELSLELGLPAGGLERVWPREVGSIGELPRVVGEITNAELFNRELGEGASFRAGDIVILSATENSERWEAGFYRRGEGPWTNPELTIIVTALDFFAACDSAGVNIADRKLQTLDGVSIVGTVEDPEAFTRAFDGEGAVARGATVILEPSASGTTAFTAHGSDMPVWGFEIREGELLKLE